MAGSATLSCVTKLGATFSRSGSLSERSTPVHGVASAVFFNRLGEIRDRPFENQRYRASGLNLMVAAITLWNTVYLERAVTALRERGTVDDSLLPHLSPLSWEHIHLTGDYVWHANRRVAKGRYLRRLSVHKFPNRETTPTCTS